MSFRTENPIRARPFITALLLATILFALSVSVVSPYYETNDDAVMNSIVAGQLLTSEPDEHLVFTNVLVGLMLQRLYESVPDVPWYGIYLLAVHFLATTGLLFGLLRVNSSTKQVGFSLLVFALLVAPGLAHVQFTRTAALSTLGGLSIFFSCVRKHDHGVGLGTLLAAATLVIIGFLIRWEACVLVVGIAAPALWFFARPAGRPGVRRALLCFGVVTVVGCTSGWMFDRAYYARDPGWERFRSLQGVRTGITDYNRLEYTDETRPHFDAVGWSENDLELAKHRFLLLDLGVYTDEKLTYLEAHAFSDSRSLDYRSLGQLVRVLTTDRILGALLLLAVARLVQTALNRRQLLIVASTCVVAVVAAWYLHAVLHLVERVTHGIFSVPVLVLMMLPYQRTPQRSQALATSTARWAPAAVLVSVIALFIQNGIRGSERHRLASVETIEKIEALALTPEDVVVVWGGDLPYEDIVRPLDDGRLRDRLTLLSTGWPSLSPLTAKRMQEFRIHDVYRAIYTRDDVYLAAFDWRTRAYARFVCEHHETEVAFDVRSDDPEIYAVSRQLPTSDAPRVPISIRWRSDAPPHVRRELERRYRLRAPVPILGPTWRYRVTEETDITGLLLSGAVEAIEGHALDEHAVGSVRCHT